MIAVRYAISDPEKTSVRATLLDAHKVHLRSAPFEILVSGPSATPGADSAGRAVVIARVSSLEEFEAFSAEDPLVKRQVYRHVDIFEWRPTVGSKLDIMA